MKQLVMDRERHIWDKLTEHYNETVSLGREVLGVFVQGSQNYNLDIYTDNYKSDIDTKAIVLPSFDDFCRGYQPLSTTHVRVNNEHIDLKDIRIMFDTFKKQNINFVEILFTDFFIAPSEYISIIEELRGLGEELVHCHPAQTVRTMSGMSMEKRKALCHPYPTIKDKIEKYGYDGKQLHHIIRINEFIKNYISGMSFKDCLANHSPKLLEMMKKAKLNEYTLDEAIRLADFYNEDTNNIKIAFVEQHEGEFDGKAYKKLEDIKVKVLKQWFKKQIG